MNREETTRQSSIDTEDQQLDKTGNREAPKHDDSNKEGASSSSSSSGRELWTDGLLCAFELVRERTPPTTASRRRGPSGLHEDDSSLGHTDAQGTTPRDDRHGDRGLFRNAKSGKRPDSHWVPIGWKRIDELVRSVQAGDNRDVEEEMGCADVEGGLTVADLAAPYWERPAGPTWWCHVAAGHASVSAWLSEAQWLHPAITVALRDESQLISDRMKYLRYEVPIRAAGGLLFELLGQSVGDPFQDEDIPIVLRSWQAQNFLITALHMKGFASNVNVLGITEVEEILFAGGSTAPKTIHEVIAHLASRLSRWDDRLFRKYVFGTADEIELKFVNRRTHEDLNLVSVILNEEIRRLAMQVIRVKWSLHAREEIIFELLHHLRGPVARNLLEEIRKMTREMLAEQEAVRGRLFTIQDVMQSTVRAWLQDKSLCITHNLAVIGGAGLVLSVITGLFGVNLDGMPGGEDTPYAFGLFSAMLLMVGAILIGMGMLYFGLHRPLNEEKIKLRRSELGQLVSMFQHEAETHAKVRQDVLRNNLPPTAADVVPDADYILITR